MASILAMARDTGANNLAAVSAVHVVAGTTMSKALGSKYTTSLVLAQFPLPLSQNADKKTRADLLGAIQAGLAERGFDPGPADGSKRPATTMAISAYQSKMGLDVSGEPSVNLLDHIKMTRQLRSVSDGSQKLIVRRLVENVQLRLARLGYTPGATSGVVNGPTRQAIAKYERDRGLPVTGELSRQLVRKLSQPNRRAPL
ncbi:MAG: peptidoglycan-binding domain-containing protein [Alphaproteobacteria bacterium]